jgi:hypothetical protein
MFRRLNCHNALYLLSNYFFIAGQCQIQGSGAPHAVGMKRYGNFVMPFGLYDISPFTIRMESSDRILWDAIFDPYMLDSAEMHAFVRALAILAILLAPAMAIAEGKGACTELSESVRTLGIPWEAAHEETVHQLHECGLRAVPLLIAELRVVDPESVSDPQWGHMVWCERALRSITGQYFTFHTAQHLGRVSEFRSKDDPLGYAMEWMSRGKVYIAPRDLQERVIQEWKSWIIKNHGQFRIAEFQPFGEWFW